MNNQFESHNFSDKELEALDACLSSVPAEHLRMTALREFRRDTYLVRIGRGYPTVMAVYTAETGSAVLYDGAFLGSFGPPSHPTPLPDFAIHCAIGCSLAFDESILAGWRRAAGKTDGEPAAALVLEKNQISSALKFDGSSLVVDVGSLASGVDFAVAYAAYCSFGELLKQGMPAVHRYIQTTLFSAAGPAQDQELHRYRILRG